MKWQDKTYPKPWGSCLVGAYSLDVYCATGKQHSYEADSASFGGKNKSDCIRQARAKGWKIDRKKDLAICPECQKTQNS